MSSTIQTFKVSSQKQCSRRNGLRENGNENTDQIVIKTLEEIKGEEINEVDLDRTHRLGATKHDQAYHSGIRKIQHKKQNFQKQKEIKEKKGQYNRKLNKDANGVP